MAHQIGPFGVVAVFFAVISIACFIESIRLACRYRREKQAEIIDSTLWRNGSHRLPYESDSDAITRLEWIAGHPDEAPTLPGTRWSDVSGVTCRHVDWSSLESIGRQLSVAGGERYSDTDLELANCPRCRSTLAREVPAKEE